MVNEHAKTRGCLRARLVQAIDRLAASLDGEAVVVSPGAHTMSGGGVEMNPPMAWVTSDGDIMTGNIRWLARKRPDGGYRPALVSECIAYIHDRLDGMADVEALRIESTLLLVSPPKHAPAVLEHVAPLWPWSTTLAVNEGAAGRGFDVLRRLVILEHVESRRGTLGGVAAREELLVQDAWRASEPWPLDVAPADARAWIVEGVERLGRGRGAEYVDYCEQSAAERGPGWGGLPPVTIGTSYVLGHQLAAMFSAVQAVERGRRVSAFKLPASKHAHAAAMMFVRPPAAGEKSDTWPAAKLRGAELVLTWAGKQAPYQLALLGDAEGSIDEEIARGLVAELGADALRDWLALHRTASGQGADGAFRWTWEEHRERTHYADVVRNGKAHDADLARATRQRIWRFKQAELWAEGRARDGKVLRERVGPFGLIDVNREILEADGLTPAVVAGRFNPKLYSPTGKAERAGFTLLPDAALRLPTAPLRILVSAVYAMRRASGVSRMKARTLWEYAGLADRQRQDKRRWPQCRTATERALGELEAVGVRWTGGGDGPDAVYELTAPTWWTDRLVHRVGPVLEAPATAGVPRTGAELGAMRKARGLSQRVIAGVVGASHQTVMRTEKHPGALPAEWLPKLAAAGLTMPA